MPIRERLWALLHTTGFILTITGVVWFLLLLSHPHNEWGNTWVMAAMLLVGGSCLVITFSWDPEKKEPKKKN